jgi:hypothetical protein
MNLEGLVEKKNRSGTIYYENSIGEIVAKTCRKCGKVKDLDFYNKDASKFSGRRGECIECTRENGRNHYRENQDRLVRESRERTKRKRESAKENRINDFIKNNEDIHTKLSKEGYTLHESRGTFYYKKSGKLYARKCGKCCEFKKSCEFDKSEVGLGGFVTICKKCLYDEKQIKLKNYWFSHYKRDPIHNSLLTKKEIDIKFMGKTSIYYVSKEILIARNCAKCDNIKYSSDFYRSNGNSYGVSSRCKTCVDKEYIQYISDPLNHKRKLIMGELWRNNHQVHIRELRIKRYYLNRDECLRKNREWQIKNRLKVNVNMSRRRARKANLPDTLITEEYAQTLEYFDNACALTGETDGIAKEHAIPLAIGHGGTVFENCYPLRADLNASKGDSNIFEWFEANRQRFELSQERFDKLIAWLASANAMTVEEYRDYVYWCHANPRSIDELSVEPSNEESLGIKLEGVNT